MVAITIQTDQPVTVVIPKGRIDALTSTEVDQALRPLIEKENHIIIDLSQCDYLSSAGIRILLVSGKKLTAKGGKLFLSGLLPEVFQVIEMAGLHQIFSLYKSVEAAQAEIEQINILSSGSLEWQKGNFAFRFQPLENIEKPALLWENQGIVGYNELDFTVGIGTPAESIEEEILTRGIFISTGYCAGFIPFESIHQADFRIPKEPSNAGIFVKKALSFGQQPAGMVRIAASASITLGCLAEALTPIRQKLGSGDQDMIAMVVASFDTRCPSITVCLPPDQKLIKHLNLRDPDEIQGVPASADAGKKLWGAKFILDEVPDLPEGTSLSDFLMKALTLENLINVGPISSDDLLADPVTWIFASKGMEDASDKRLVIQTTDDLVFEPHKAFLARRLYTDSARIVIKQIHGGYSAQTYEVTSFNHEKRKLRPTVLKMANRNIIMRESDRCQKYALPYILNNSAIVLGTKFFGDFGALRYNFVGIGGEHTQLKWLAHYFKSWPLPQLEPLFDKIFLQILKPWYGQPISETIHPFADHDPTATFFPTLCQTAAELLSVPPDEPTIEVAETGQTLTNPYWYLKHELPRQRQTGIDYYTAICHGDLNMQNILLDEDMNVYLIDFSETRPRSVVSDFARLEAIFMIEHAPLDNAEEMEEYLKFIAAFYEKITLGEPLVNNYKGPHSDKINRLTALTQKMRDYAFQSAQRDPNPVPYCLALLEWTLPVVCYSSTPLQNKRLSMVISGLICGNIKN
ncbi:MAG: anti-sigma factor antagonist [Prolixibacteraceae bacterium]